MEAQKYLSPGEILSILKCLGNAIPQRENKEYISQLITVNGIVSEEKLNEEAQRMMNFLGLSTYTSNCKYDDEIKENVGAYIRMSRNVVGSLDIVISPRMKYSPKALVAILAHGLCHKRLEDSSIIFPKTEEGCMQNEYYTDICTIYMGLGRHVLDGYYDNNSVLGYLKPEMYEQACLIIDDTRDIGGVEQNLNKHELISNKFIEVEKDATSLWRNMQTCRCGLDVIDNHPKDYLWCSVLMKILVWLPIILILHVLILIFYLT